MPSSRSTQDRYLAVVVVSLLLGTSAIPTAVEARSPADRALPNPVPISEGPNSTTVARLWSGDEDMAGEASGRRPAGDLLALVDYPFAEPPPAVDRWNALSLQEFPRTDVSTSVSPPGADRRNRDWIRDAYLEIYAVSPGTLVHRTATDTRTFIRPTGTVSATTDYRIQLPPDTRRSYSPPPPRPGHRVLVSRAVTHRLVSATESDVTLAADGVTIATDRPTATPAIHYAGLPRSTRHLEIAMTISATIEVTTRKQYRRARRVCHQVGNVTRCSTRYSTDWTTDRAYPSRDLTVRDTVRVRVSNLAPTVEAVTFVDGRDLLVINQSAGTPWSLARLPDGSTVHNGWSFYAAGDRDWARLARHDDTGTEHVQSAAIPLGLHAFPAAGGPYIPRGQPTALTIVKTWGPIEDPPTLPGSITVPVVTDRFEQSRAVAIQAEDPLPMGGSLRVQGLVRGSTARPTVTASRHQRATTLTLSVDALDRRAGTAEVDVRLTESASGRPIDLRARPGSIVVNGISLDTDSTGRTRATVPIASRVVTARYVPGPWWTTDPAFAPSTDRETLPVRWPDPRRILEAGVLLLAVLAPLFLLVYLIDRVTGRSGLWPPWRGIR